MWPFNLFKPKSASRPRNAGGRADAAAPGTVARARIDSRVYPVVQLDHTTVTIDGFTGDMVPRQRFHFAFCLEVDGEEVEVPTSGTVLQVAGGRVVAKYLAPQPYYQRIMRRALAQRAA
ncbi:hypothetical protein [Rhodovibrio salinarum]|uniref:Uncharacterized protein n=1 Tax=Rhodovibrio salinarum TaxID=1087 RepID=A0A934QGZ2_9PROT|nr:hypothetical protein [Rhodovibrio salinarum]MBK1696848.1 hypothetical protein [Rhodovibrio salinarum]